MKVKKIKIQIKSLDNALDEFVAVAGKVKRGVKVAAKTATYVADAETARAIFTESRLKLIHVVKHKAPKSIYELAKIVKRDFKNVYDDVVFLTEIGILGITESKDGRKQKQPSLLCESILFEIAA
jgi:predicted transcriptional regulator